MAETLQAGSAGSDAELITRVRAGDRAAYGELYARHSAAALTLARQFSRSPAEADDLVSESFARVLDTLIAGGGPDAAFRAYLFTTLRNTAYDRTRKDKRLSFTDDVEAHDVAVEADDPVLLQAENSLVGKAFTGLPERWQAVLWYTQVDGMSPAEAGVLLGMSANAVTSLAYRAREGLREAYLQAHLADTAAERCRTTVDRLGAWARGGLSKREQAQVDAHLEECDRCRALAAELTEINSGIRGIIAPLLLGGAAVAYLAATVVAPPLALVSTGAFLGSSSAAAGTGATAGAAGATGGHAAGVAGLWSRPWAVAGAGGVVVAVGAIVAVVVALTSHSTPSGATNGPGVTQAATASAGVSGVGGTGGPGSGTAGTGSAGAGPGVAGSGGAGSTGTNGSNGSAGGTTAAAGQNGTSASGPTDTTPGSTGVAVPPVIVPPDDGAPGGNNGAAGGGPPGSGGTGGGGGSAPISPVVVPPPLTVTTSATNPESTPTATTPTTSGGSSTAASTATTGPAPTVPTTPTSRAPSTGATTSPSRTSTSAPTSPTTSSTSSTGPTAPAGAVLAATLGAVVTPPAGGNGSVSFTVGNSGGSASTATPISLGDTLGATIVAGTASQAASASGLRHASFFEALTAPAPANLIDCSTDPRSCSLGSIAPGSTATVTLTIHLPATAASGRLVVDIGADGLTLSTADLSFGAGLSNLALDAGEALTAGTSATAQLSATPGQGVTDPIDITLPLVDGDLLITSIPDTCGRTVGRDDAVTCTPVSGSTTDYGRFGITLRASANGRQDLSAILPGGQDVPVQGPNGAPLQVTPVDPGSPLSLTGSYGGTQIGAQAMECAIPNTTRDQCANQDQMRPVHPEQTLTIPAGATVVAATLTWAAAGPVKGADPSSLDTLTLNLGNTATTITGGPVPGVRDLGDTLYVRAADVTDLITTSGTVSVTGIAARTTLTSTQPMAGWTLDVVWFDPSAKPSVVVDFSNPNAQSDSPGTGTSATTIARAGEEISGLWTTLWATDPWADKSIAVGGRSVTKAPIDGVVDEADDAGNHAAHTTGFDLLSGIAAKAGQRVELLNTAGSPLEGFQTGSRQDTLWIGPTLVIRGSATG